MQVSAGRVETGDVVAAAYLLTLLAVPVRAFGWVLGEVPRALVGYDRIARVIDAHGALSVGTTPWSPGAGARVELRDVGRSVALPGGGELELLHDVDLDVAPGRTVAIVGSTGAGKTTLVVAGRRLADPSHGAVRVDGVDLRDVGPADLSRHVALVAQSTFVFEDTVRGNVTLADPGDGRRRPTTRRSGTRCASPASTTSSVRCPAASTRRSASAAPTSRAASGSASRSPAPSSGAPRVLVLDDATSAVDPRIEQAILRGLRGAAAPAARPCCSSRTGCRRCCWPTRSCTSRAAASSTAARTTSCSRATPATASSRPRTSRRRPAARPRPPTRRPSRSGGAGMSGDHRIAPASTLGVLATLRRGDPGLAPAAGRARRHGPARGRRRDRSRPRADRGPADRRHGDPRAGRPGRRRASRRSPALAALGLAGRRRVLGATSTCGCSASSESRPAVAAHPGVPARARPVRAHPEHRAPRLARLARDLGRRHDLAVRAVGRHHAARLGAADRGRHRADGRLLVAAHAARLARLRAARRRCCSRCRSGSTRRYTAVRERVGAMLGAVSEAVVGAETIRAYGVAARTQRRIDARDRGDHARAMVRAQNLVAARLRERRAGGQPRARGRRRRRAPTSASRAS